MLENLLHFYFKRMPLFQFVLSIWQRFFFVFIYFFFFVPFDFTHVNKQNEFGISMIAYKNVSVVDYSQEFALSLPTFFSKFYSESRMKQKTYTDTPSSSSILYCNNRYIIMDEGWNFPSHFTFFSNSIEFQLLEQHEQKKSLPLNFDLFVLYKFDEILEIMQSKELK